MHSHVIEDKWEHIRELDDIASGRRDSTIDRERVMALISRTCIHDEILNPEKVIILMSSINEHDDVRYILPNGINTVALDHYMIEEIERTLGMKVEIIASLQDIKRISKEWVSPVYSMRWGYLPRAPSGIPLDLGPLIWTPPKGYPLMA